MKKTLCLFLALAMLLGMTAGCSGKKDPTAAPTTAPAVTEAPSTAVPATEAPATEAPTEAPATEAPATQVPTEEPSSEAPVTEAPTEVSPTEPPATEPPTEPPTEAPPEGSALYAYQNAVLPSSYRLTLHWEMSRSMGKELLITTDDRVLTVLNADDPASMTASEQWDRHIEGNAIDQRETYRSWFARGNTVMEQDRRYYRAAQKAEDFLAVRPPLAMLTPENYGSVEWTDESRSAIRFSEAEDTEWEWLGLNCTGITEAAGIVELDARGQIARTVYDAVFSLEGIDVAVHVSADLEDWSEPVEIPKISSGRAVPVGSVEAIPLLDLASCGFLTDGFTGNYVAFIQSLAAGSVLLQQGWYGIDEDQAGPMLLEKVSKTTYSLTTKSTDVEYRHYGGRTVYQVDGKDQEPAGSPEAIEEGILDFLYDFWPDLTYLENLSLSEEEDCWLIQAELNRDGMKWFHGNTEYLMFSQRGYMDDLGVSFRPGTATLWLSVDKGSGFPIHSLIEFEGDHRYEGQTLEVSAQLEWNYLPADPDAHYVITEKWEDKGAPEVPATPLFYRVTAPDGGSLWLLGTIHIGDLRTSYLPQELYDALLSSDALAVEIDVTNMEERLEEDDDLLEAYQASILYPDGSSPFDHLNEEQGEKLKNALHLYGGDMMASLLNYNVATLTSLLEQETLPLGRLHSYEHGVDNQLVNLAKENGIPVRDVEDFVEHISLLSGFSEELQALMLEETIDGGRYGSNMGAAELFDVWCRGDEEEIARSFEEEEEDEELTEEEQALVEEYNRGMMTLRNAKMVERAQEYLASGETVFFAVGLAHLVGEDGIVNSLRNLGYTVEPVRYGE
ncbi:MAG: TraB/GumN family protein [Lachnospiraceae bacterium]|nr:TraB/GumN family protein [Lachnospiraceae bacterium]